MKLLSDLHTEFWEPGYFPDYLTQPEDILVLAGDIAVGRNKVQKLLTKLADYHNHIIYVPGNHEYYGYSINNLDSLNLPSNVYLLNPGIITINDTTFIGATLWTDFDNSPTNELIAKKYITDFRKIKNFSTSDAKVLFNKHSNYIRDAIKILPGNKVIITHFLPGKHCVHPRWQSEDYPVKQLSSYFAPDPKISLDSVSHWLFGHTHDSIDITLNNTRFLANPYGYRNYEENKSFNPNLLF